MTASRTRMTVISGAVLAAFLALAIVVWPRHTPRNDFAEPVDADGLHTATVVDGGTWTAEVGDDCLRFRADGMVTQCWSLHYGTGASGGSAVIEGRGHRILWVIEVADRPVTVRWWSSTAIRVDHTSVKIGDSLQLVAFELQPGEDPYGFQVWDADGHLLWVSAVV